MGVRRNYRMCRWCRASVYALPLEQHLWIERADCGRLSVVCEKCHAEHDGPKSSKEPA